MPDSSLNFVVRTRHPRNPEIVKTPFFIETMMNSFQGFAELRIFDQFPGRHWILNACTKIISVSFLTNVKEALILLPAL